MDYRGSFSADASRRPAQRNSLLSPSLATAYGSPMSRSRYSISSPISPSATSAAAMASLSPITTRSLLLSSAAAAAAASSPLDRTIRLHRRDPLPPIPTAGDASSSSCGQVRLSLRPLAASFPAVPRRRRPRLPSAAVSPEVQQRKRFLVFTKVLLKCLRRSKDDRLYHQAKAIIADCIQRNRRQEANYMPLPQAVERHLRPVVGEAQWKRANACLELYLEKKGQLSSRRPAAAAAAAASTVDPLNVFPELCRPQQQGGKPTKAVSL